ncbi:MAG: hypothetical protein IPK16_04960 [Anaerolineales bacterium]|nr:hypothetical protein [Anaerolineales bacterium]
MPTKLPICVEMPSPEDAGSPSVRVWPPGMMLHIRFLDGAHTLRAKVAAAASEWLHYAHISFAFGDDPDAPIRITFADDALWSFVGTDALLVPKDQPTLSLGALTTRTDAETLRRVVLHMFGHVLGLAHEHQSPASDMPWNIGKLYAYFAAAPFHWTQQQVDANILAYYAGNWANLGDFDPRSIMLAPIPGALILGDFEVGWNAQLSQTDLAWVAMWYPRQSHSALPDETPPDGGDGETQDHSPEGTAASVKDVDEPEAQKPEPEGTAEELKEERIRLDVGVQELVYRDIPFDLAVAVQQPSAPALAEDGLPIVISKPGVVFRPDRESVIEYQIEVTGADCDIEPPAEKIQLHRGENAAPVYFRVTAHRTGQQSLFVKAYQVDHKVAAQTRVLIAVQVPVEEQPDQPTSPAARGAPPAMLSPAEVQQFEAALLGAFNRSELSRVVYVGLADGSGHHRGARQPRRRSACVGDVGKSAREGGCAAQAARAQNPGNDGLREFAKRIEVDANNE